MPSVLRQVLPWLLVLAPPARGLAADLADVEVRKIDKDARKVGGACVVTAIAPAP